MFLISNKLEQLEFKLEKNIGIYKHAGKVRKDTIHYLKINESGKIAYVFQRHSNSQDYIVMEKY